MVGAAVQVGVRGLFVSWQTQSILITTDLGIGLFENEENSSLFTSSGP